ncbi:MAG: D-alanyl-D-alanine carboxypeptidase/D-alanyl-D-alanine-endopeptidase [Polyangiales bacterium]
MPSIKRNTGLPVARAQAGALLVLASLLGVLAGHAQPGTLTDLSTEIGLKEHLRAAIERADLGEQVGISVVDARSGRSVFSLNATAPLNPASNMKLVTAAATLLELGPDFHMLTGLYGQVQGDAVVSGLYFKGYGDPTLTDADLVVLAQQLVARGVQKVDEVVVDGSYFDDQLLAPGFEEQPNEVSPFRAAIAAVSVNENAFTLRVNPGPIAGAPASAWVDAEGHFTLSNAITTSPGGAPNVIAVQSQKADKLVLHLSGSVPLGIAGVSYERRVESPLHYAGYALVEALRAMRIQVPRRVRLATMPKGTALLASHQSPPLAQMLGALGKQSDNFVAETLLKVLGAERVGVPGRSSHGASAALSAMKRLGVPPQGMRMVNGSGLFGGGRVSAGQLTKLLAAMYGDPSVRPEFVAQLAVAGVDGTLVRRMKQLPAPRIVRAKTGTLDDVIALSGYVLGRAPERVLAFSVLCNGVHGKHAAARELTDQVATNIALHLWAPERPSSPTPHP